MKSFRVLVLMGLCITAGCQATKEHYPYSPQFADTTDVPATVLSVPPQTGSAEHQHAIADILKRQQRLDDATIAAIHEEVPVVPEMVAKPVLGETFTRAAFPKLYALLDRSGSDAHRISDHAKDYWHTQRPYETDARVKLVVKPIGNPSYPSGHTLIGHVWAGVLNDVAPCKREALFARAHVIAEHRMDAGAHYYYDIDAGKRMASATLARMQSSSAYQDALHDAKRETAGKICA